jgi:putative DNA primase/helicase
VEAELVVERLGAKRVGSGWMARCPAHDDRVPSLSIRTTQSGEALVHCFAGCSQARVVAALRALGPLGMSGQRELSRTTRSRPGLGEASRSEAALRVWSEARRAEGSLVEDYLRSRGLHLPIPEAVRFHPALLHTSGGIWPAMVALVTRGFDGTPAGVHRTFLDREFPGKAPTQPQRMMLGPCGGGAVRLALPNQTIMIGEGIETCLAAMQATGIPAWAALSTSGLRTLNLPDAPRDVIILADGDEPGEAAAQHSARRWLREGRRVRIARPPRGMDFNDLLTGHDPRNEATR